MLHTSTLYMHLCKQTAMCTYLSIVSSLINFWAAALSQKLALQTAMHCPPHSHCFPSTGCPLYPQTKHLNAGQWLLHRCNAYSPQQCQKQHHAGVVKMPRTVQELLPLVSKIQIVTKARLKPPLSSHSQEEHFKNGPLQLGYNCCKLFYFAKVLFQTISSFQALN